MELETLPGGDPERAVAEPVGQVVEREILLRGHRAGRNGDAHHELPGLLPAFGLAPPARVAVVLLVGAVELEQLEVVVPEVGRLPGQRIADRAPQVTAVALGQLDLGRRLGGHDVILTRGVMRWRPHSVLCSPVQRPSRLYSPSSLPGTGSVQWVHPMLG